MNNEGAGPETHAKPARYSPYGTSDTIEEEPEEGWFSRRYVVAYLALFGFANIYAMRANLSVAIVQMCSGVTEIVNGTLVHKPGEFGHWSPLVQGLVLSSFFYGYIITQLPGGYLSYKNGGKITFMVGVLGTAIFTLLTPPLAKLGWFPLALARFLEGMFEGVTYPAMHVIWSKWAPPQEKTTLVTVSFSGSYFGTVIAMPLSAYIGTHFGWPSIFFFFGAAALIWCYVWEKNVYERPADDPKISTQELTLLQRDAISETVHIVPWRDILTSGPVWAVIIAHTAQNWGFYTLLTNLPHIFNDLTDFDFEKAGVLSGLPFLLMGIIILSTGKLADYLQTVKQYDTIFVRRAFCVVGFLVQAVMIYVVFTFKFGGLAIILGVTFSIAFGGLCWSAFSVNPLDLAPQYAGHLMAVSNTIATLPGILAPLFVGFIAPDKDNGKWLTVLFICSSFYIIGAAAYYRLSDAKRQPWADNTSTFVTQLE